MRNIFCIFLDRHRIKTFEKNLEFFLRNIEEYTPDNCEFLIINLSYLEFFNKGIDLRSELNKKNLFQPKSFNELIILLKKNNIICVNKILYNFSNIFFHILLKKHNIRQIIIGNLGYFPVENQTKTKNINHKLNIFFNIKLKNYFFRILSYLKIISTIDIFFTSSEIFKNQIEKTKNGKIFSKLYVPFYKKIVRVNSSYYDKYLDAKVKSEEYIVYCDSGFDHYDRIRIEGQNSEDSRDKFYKNLYDFFSFLKEKYNKEIVYCKHPKAPYPKSKYFQKIENDFIVKIYKTEDYIEKAFLTIFCSSLLVNYAMLNKKRILFIKSKYLGKFISNRNANFFKQFDFDQTSIDDENYKNLDFNKINENLLMYNNYIKDNLIIQTGIKSTFQIKNYLNDFLKATN